MKKVVITSLLVMAFAGVLSFVLRSSVAQHEQNIDMPTMPDAIEASPGTNVCEEVFNREALEHKITQAEEEIKGIEAKAHLLLHCAKISENCRGEVGF